MKRNEYLTPVLEKYGQNNDDVWKSIAMNNGSVLHLDFLSEHEKEVFKTAYEINQMAIVRQAASRQKYIDQGQSLNIFVPCSVNAKDYHDLHYLAWTSGIRTLYYSRSTSAMSAATKSNIDKTECNSCQG
jgi:ribonucleoside-diphosphate reductase alpha chain